MYLLRYTALIGSILIVVGNCQIENDVRIHGENGWYIPKLNGTFEWMELTKAEAILNKLQQSKWINLYANPVNFYLYTNKNRKLSQTITNYEGSLGNSNFNSSNPTRIVIHGWFQSYLFPMNYHIREAWLTNGNYNIIVVDWPRARSLDYISSVVAVPTVGRKVAEFIEYLVATNRTSLDAVHIIGHSLGAHIAGYAGKQVTSGKVYTIIGLDPASPLFSYNKPANRLASTDAYYVESIQTNGNKLGFLQPIGRGAFYPNGGKSQPGCIFDVTGICSHNLSPTYYAEAVRMNNFESIKCRTYKEANAKKCSFPNSFVRMGAITNAALVTGVYYVPVNRFSPYGTLN